MARILVAEDEEKMRHLLCLMLERRGHEVIQAADGLEALDHARASGVDMVISDIRMPRMDGVGLVQSLKQEDILCPVVFITAFATVDSAVEAMHQGAADYITKPFEADRVLLAVERTLNLSKVLAENAALRRELSREDLDETIVYVSEPMKQVMELAAKVSAGDSAVLISGESGTGKEILARFIHRSGPRRHKRFVAVNCAAISPGLVESELFGHEKGAFTSAVKQNQGKFEYAAGGTLFLDEIGDLPLEAQAKLLRTLQEKTVQRVGGNEEIRVDARIICATNRDLPELVQRGTFRRDLFFRIDVFPIVTPPLRKRPADILPLARHFLRKMAGGRAMQLTEAAERTLCEYFWPGNVRELSNAIERAVILAVDDRRITAETLSFLKAGCKPPSCEDAFRLPAGGISLEALQQDAVRQALEASGNNQSEAARLLGLSRAKFRNLVKSNKL